MGWRNGIHFGRESNEPLFAIVAPEKNAETNLGESESFLKVGQDNIIVTAMKKAENEDAMVIRMYNYEDADTGVELLIWKAFGKADETNLIEEEKKSLAMEGNKLKLDVGHHEIKTVKLK
jgi:alpha-mannosidase